MTTDVNEVNSAIQIKPMQTLVLFTLNNRFSHSVTFLALRTASFRYYRMLLKTFSQAFGIKSNLEHNEKFRS